MPPRCATRRRLRCHAPPPAAPEPVLPLFFSLPVHSAAELRRGPSISPVLTSIAGQEPSSNHQQRWCPPPSPGAPRFRPRLHPVLDAEESAVYRGIAELKVRQEQSGGQSGRQEKRPLWGPLTSSCSSWPRRQQRPAQTAARPPRQRRRSPAAGRAAKLKRSPNCFALLRAAEHTRRAPTAAPAPPAPAAPGASPSPLPPTSRA